MDSIDKTADPRLSNLVTESGFGRDHDKKDKIITNENSRTHTGDKLTGWPWTVYRKRQTIMASSTLIPYYDISNHKRGLANF